MKVHKMRWLLAGVGIAVAAGAVASLIRRSGGCGEPAAEATGAEPVAREARRVPQPVA